MNNGGAGVARLQLPRKYPGQLQARFCQPQDIVNRVLFLASDESKSINGAEMRMANYKTPQQVEVMGALPTNASGKVLKYPLRASA